MINSSTTNENGVKQRKRRTIIGCMALVFLLGISAGLYFILSNGANVVDTKKTQQQIRNGEETLILGEYKICLWEAVDMDTHIPFMIDGKNEGFFDVEEEILVQGYLCGTDQEVLLAVDEQGVHGSILNFDKVVQITAIDGVHSTFEISDQEQFPEFTESDKTKAADEKWKKYIASKQNDRRKMQALQPGSVDIHIHLDIDKHMVDTYGSAYAAARYGVELIAVVNRDAYVGLGFNLKVVSINARTSFLSQTATTDAYLTALEQISRPINVNLLHSLSTRDLGGGIAYIGGLYTRNYCYGVSEIYGNFATWDRYVVAHELGHNFGADHTHEMQPQVDTCGTSCPSNPQGTIMSYCHLCSGGMSNLQYEWHQRVRDVILNAYATGSGSIATRYDCQNFPAYPDVGVPFSLKGDDCLTIDVTACAECSVNTCTLDSVFFFTGSQIKASQDPSFCWTASTACDSISLQACGDAASQQFSFQSNSLTSALCGQVKHDAGSAFFAGSLVSAWCSPSVDPNDDPTCDQPIISLECGGTHSGSTVNDCEGQRLFTFVAPEGPVTVSSCGSSYDTILSIEKDGERLHYSDDDGTCNNRAEIVNINNLAQGVEYSIILEGYRSEVGSYDISLTCGDDAIPDPSLTEEPTDNNCDSIPMQLECGSPVTGSTVNACGGEQRFVFEATTTMKTISTCGSNYDTIIYVYDSSDSLLDENDDYRGCGLRSQIDNLSLDVGSQYYVILTGWSNAVGDYRMELTCQDPPSLKPTSDMPSSSPTTSLPTLTPSSSPDTTDPTLVPEFDYTLSPTTDMPSLAPTTSLPSLSPTTDMPSSSPDTTRPTIVPAPLDELEPTMDPTSDPVLDCTSAITTIGCGDVVSGTTVGTCDSRQRFAFTATTDLKTISSCGSSYDTILVLYDSNDVEIARQDDSESNHCGYYNSLMESVPLTVGEEYTVVLSGFYLAEVGDYKMELICDAPPDECESAIVDITCGETLTGSTRNSCDGEKVFAFTATTDLKTISACDSDFDTILYLYGPGGEVIHHNDDSDECSYQSFIDNYRVEVGAEYQIVLAGYRNEVGSYKIELTCDDIPPCDDSIQTLTCGDVLTQSTLDRCDGVQTFAFTATHDLTTISTCNSEFDTMLQITSDNGFNAANDDNSDCGYHSKLSDMELQEGDNYVVTLSGFYGIRGNYRLEVTCNTKVTYTRDRRGKCRTLDGGTPSHEFHTDVNLPECEQLCTDRSDCGGFSWSRFHNCLLWTQNGLMGGGPNWGRCHCYIKDDMLVDTAEPEESG